jgi:hypothetical protein
VRHFAAPEDDQAGCQLLFVHDKRHATLHCAESVQVRGEGARKSITVQVLCSGLCHILLGDSSYLLESCHPDNFSPIFCFQIFMPSAELRVGQICSKQAQEVAPCPRSPAPGALPTLRGLSPPRARLQKWREDALLTMTGIGT